MHENENWWCETGSIDIFYNKLNRMPGACWRRIENILDFFFLKKSLILLQRVSTAYWSMSSMTQEGK